MNNILNLFAGEIQRIKRYHILTASLFVAAIWIGVLHSIEVKDVSTFFPLLLYVDATQMSIILMGVIMFYEKQEGSIKSLLVSPISKTEYIFSKVFANVSSNFLTLFILFLYATVFKELNVNIFTLMGAVALIALFHSLLGVFLTYYSADFTSLLMGMMKYAFIAMIPVILEHVGIIANDVIRVILYAVPTKAAMILLAASAGGFEAWEIGFSVLYLTAASAFLLVLVLRKFDEFAVKESGV